MQEIVCHKLQSLEETGKQYWNIPKETGKLLNLIIKAAGYKNILEIGTSNGYSTIWLAEAARVNSGHVTTIEYFQERIDLAKKNFEDSNLSDYITQKQGKALEILSELKRQEWDFVFIDANKAEYIKYFELIHTGLRSKGLIVADNVTSHQEEMKNFLNLVKNHPEYQESYIPHGGGLLLLLKA